MGVLFPIYIVLLYQQALMQSRSRSALFSATATDRSSKGEEDNELIPMDQMTILTRGDRSAQKEEKTQG
jgi:hypothetical protein